LGKAFETAGLSDYTRTGTFSGTLEYMPRQQVYNFKYSGPELDVWAAAAIFYRMITGYYPRNFPDKNDRWRAVLNTSPIPIRERDTAIPARLAEVIDRALEDEDSLHFTTADQLKKALLRVLPR
jgi:serine/threonine protein kinase